MNKDALLEFLHNNGYDIIWTVLGEKNILGYRIAPGDWIGHLEISGVYRIHGGDFEGGIKTRLVARG